MPVEKTCLEREPRDDVARDDVARDDVARDDVATGDVATGDGRPGDGPAAVEGSGRVIGESGMATAEYAIATLAACGFAGLLLTLLKSGEVNDLLFGIVRRALSI